MSVNNNKIPLIAVVGPTASGKTAAGVMLAKIYDGEVVSADSMQIYKGMSIASAKPTKEEMQGVPHHLIDFADNDVSFSVADYVALAKKTINGIVARGRTPVLVGGTGLYINSLIDNVRFESTCGASAVRDELYAYAETNGAHALWERLNKTDPQAAETIHENNIPRVVRALEVCITTGEKFSVHKVRNAAEESDYNSCIIGLDFHDRAVLYDRINKRVDEMLKNGLVAEAEQFLNNDDLHTANQAIGIKELRPYFSGEATLDDCIENIKMQTRRYAKRQLTWFRKRDDINWVYLDELNLLNFNEEFIKILKTIVAKSDVL